MESSKHPNPMTSGNFQQWGVTYMGLKLKQTKLHIVKTVVNKTVVVLKRLVPPARATYPVSKETQRLFNFLIEVADKDELMDDNHFRDLLAVTKNGLIYVCENDNFYRDYLSLLYKLIKMEEK